MRLTVVLQVNIHPLFVGIEHTFMRGIMPTLLHTRPPIPSHEALGRDKQTHSSHTCGHVVTHLQLERPVVPHVVSSELFCEL